MELLTVVIHVNGLAGKNVLPELLAEVEEPFKLTFQ
jgi:hypothetical protein